MTWNESNSKSLTFKLVSVASGARLLGRDLALLHPGLGAQGARLTMGVVQYRVRTLRAASTRARTFYPHRSLHLCEDECIALSLIAAAQAEDAETGCHAAHAAGVFQEQQ